MDQINEQAQGERRSLYFSPDVEDNNEATLDVIRRAKALHGASREPWYIF